MTSQHGAIPAGSVPILGQQPKRVAFGASLAGIPLHIGPDGNVVILNPGEPLPRGMYLDGDQLIGALQGVFRRELRAAFTRSGLRPPDAPHEADTLTDLPVCAVHECIRVGANGLALGPDMTIPICSDHAAALAEASKEIGEEAQA